MIIVDVHEPYLLKWEIVHEILKQSGTSCKHHESWNGTKMTTFYRGHYLQKMEKIAIIFWRRDEPNRILIGLSTLT